MQAKKENPFMRHVGPMPGDPPKYVEPQDALELLPADPATTSHIRHQLAIQEAARLEVERAFAVPRRLQGKRS